MSYKKESKAAYIEKQTELFAYELYLNNKYNKNEVIERLLKSFLYTDWLLSEKEQKQMLKKAIEIANEKYSLNLEIKTIIQLN